MKNIFYIMIAALTLTSCMGIDNWDAPDARFHGTITDAITGQNILTSHDEWKIRIWERTWTATTPNHQELAVKQDGTYNNSKLFAGTYDMLPYGGPFWPCDTTKNVVLKNTTEQNFTVTPYLQVLDFEASLSGTTLTLKCRLKAPRTDLPNTLYELKPFLSLNTFCGTTNYININEYNDRRITFNRSWKDEVGDSETSKVYEIGPLPVKSGYTYHVRVGISINGVTSNKYNYSEIKTVSVP